MSTFYQNFNISFVIIALISLSHPMINGYQKLAGNSFLLYPKGISKSVPRNDYLGPLLRCVEYRIYLFLVDKATYEVIFGIGIPTEGLTLESVTSGFVFKMRYRLPAMKNTTEYQMINFDGRTLNGKNNQRKDEWRWSFYNLIEQWADK